MGYPIATLQFTINKKQGFIMPAQEKTLLARTRKLLQESNLSHLDIYKATGLSPFWLSGISTGKVRDPSVNRVQQLYEFLTGSHLAL